ncbi:pyridoxal phosphate phosphatase PHOSPHO2 [Nematolebias whitei]|uniref:pyridoxal phosphate phosphatase PHOSPHO2 n=1 Tax=Nematolebias whitei TaxID=451745 RepID=UPI00189931D5|nr:pyridoxal phosphate phosphatase PHOSPHO2 [Nematolebias whitei]
MTILVVLDFDHTVVDDNSDTWVLKCLPGQTLPDCLKNSYRKGHWTEHMGRVMSYIGDQGISPERVRGVMETIPLTSGMAELLTFISKNKSTIDCIVISDSNSIFIDWILKATGLQEAVDLVFTNPAWFNESGFMEVECYHSHDCDKCPVNLCKRRVLELYVSDQTESGTPYERVIYVGDGGNDLCPTSFLRERDVVMPRKGYTLEKLLAKLKTQEGDPSVGAEVIVWSSGSDILQALKTRM